MDIVETLKFLSDKPVVVGLAILGAGFTLLPYLRPKNKGSEQKSAREREVIFPEDFPKWSKIVNKFGYGLMGTSVFLFIVAGFVVDL